MALLKRDINEQLAPGTLKHEKAKKLGIRLVNNPTNKERCWFKIEGIPGQIHLVTKPRGRNRLTRAVETPGHPTLDLFPEPEAQTGKLYLQTGIGDDDYQPDSVELVLTTNRNGTWEMRGEALIAEVELDVAILSSFTAEDQKAAQEAASDEDYFDDLLAAQDDADELANTDIELYEGNNDDEDTAGGESLSAN